ncbi:MAG: 2'-5' RNA ligase family protein [Methanoregulaceae archaeon]
MQGTFLVELSPGTSRWKLRHLIHQIACRYHIHGNIEQNPHVTLFGPFTVREGISVPGIQACIESAASGFSPIPFLINGWETKKGINGGVLAFRLIPSEDLIRLNRAIAEHLSPVSNGCNTWDQDPDQKWFHVTVANRLSVSLADTILTELVDRSHGNQESHLPDDEPMEKRVWNQFLSILRITPGEAGILHPVVCDDGIRIRLMNEDHIVGDFDLTTHSWLHGESSAIDPSGRQQMLRRYRILRGLELTETMPDHKPDIFVISDLHLGHANIIRYCARPFSILDPGEMDRVLIRNWNLTVRENDQVFYLGDLRYCGSSKTEREYQSNLSGKITFIRGNHDQSIPGTVSAHTLECDGISFIFSHDPEDVTPLPGQWVVHGHLHNNDLRDYPFISFRNHRVNVSAEVVGYRPVSLHEITGLIKRGLLEGRTRMFLIRPLTSGYGICSGEPERTMSQK